MAPCWQGAAGVKRARQSALPWAASRGDDFMIALILGTETDWCRKIRAAGGCTLQVSRTSYALTGPKLVYQAATLPAFPVWTRLVARAIGIRYFLHLRATPEAAQ
jgi:hypothetical protein